MEVLHHRKHTSNHQTSRAIENKKFAVAVLNPKHRAFIVHVIALNIDSGDEVHPSKRAQIAYLKADEAFTQVLNKYTDFIDVFSSKLAVKLPKYTEINNHTIELVDDWQRLYSPIYSLEPVELEILKAYIKNNLANSFINPSKSLVGAPIFFDKKLDGSLRLYEDYWDLNNLTIKNWYFLLLVGKSLDRLGQAQHFTQSI